MAGKSDIACIVLAAGKSERFGSNKLLAELCGKTVLERTLDAIPFEAFKEVRIVSGNEEVFGKACRYVCDRLQISPDDNDGKWSGSCEVHISRKPETEELRLGNVICIRYPGGALSESIRQGLNGIDGMDGYLFVNADQPMLTVQSIKRLLDGFVSSPKAVHRLSAGGKGASPVMFPKDAYQELLILQGENGGKEIIKSGKYDIILTEAENSHEIIDVDTPELMAEAEAIIRIR